MSEFTVLIKFEALQYTGFLLSSFTPVYVSTEIVFFRLLLFSVSIFWMMLFSTGIDALYQVMLAAGLQ